MKQQIQIIISACALAVVALPASAQNDARTNSDGRTHAREGTNAMNRANRLNGASKASELIGMTVNNYQDEKFGKVEDLAVDVESGRIVQVILSTGGFLGIGDSLTAVPPGALHHDVSDEVLHLDANKEKLKNSPRFEMSKWADSSSSNHLAATYRQFGEAPALNFIGQGESRWDGQRNQTNQPNQAQRHQADQRNQADQRELAAQRKQAQQRDHSERNLTNQSNQTGQRNQADLNLADQRNQTDRNQADERNTVTGNNDQSWGHSRSTSAHQSMIPSERLGRLQRASKLIGMTVKNRQNETIGDVDNILVDLASGRVVAFVVSSGGFLGMGDVLSAVPPTALGFNSERDTLQLDTSKEVLARAPHFSSDKWPDFSQASYSRGVYRAYQMEPYFGTDTSDAGNMRGGRNYDDRTLGTTAPNNSGRNERDRNGQTLTSFDQGTSKADVDMTAQIRKGIMAGKNMSVNAQNVKIITNQGRVTLRGPVNTAEEKRAIGEIAERIARPGNVDNQLEIKVSSNR